MNATAELTGPKRNLAARAAALVAGLVAILSVIVLAPSPAEAYVNTHVSGRTGAITWGYEGGGAVTAQPGYQFTTPSMFVNRNGAISGSYQQELTVRYDLQRWNGSSWTFADGITFTTYLNLGAGGTALISPTTLVSRIKSPGYFRVATTVSWGMAAALPYWTGQYTGHQQFVPSYVGDMRCASVGCLRYAGSVWVNR